jgi:hypothetical protein
MPPRACLRLLACRCRYIYLFAAIMPFIVHRHHHCLFHQINSILRVSFCLAPNHASWLGTDEASSLLALKARSCDLK